MVGAGSAQKQSRGEERSPQQATAQGEPQPKQTGQAGGEQAREPQGGGNGKKAGWAEAPGKLVSVTEDANDLESVAEEKELPLVDPRADPLGSLQLPSWDTKGEGHTGTTLRR